MTTLIVLFNLKNEAKTDDYESWAKSTDLPVVRGLKSVDSFEIYRARGLFGSDAAAPYQYVEVIEIGNLGVFGEEVATEIMGRVASEFRNFAEDPVFMLTEKFS